MPNVLWFYIVASIGLLLLIFTFIRKRPLVDLLSFFLASAAVDYLLEVVVLFVFRSYNYRPGLFPDPIAEDIFGHLLCNGLFWGGFIMLVSACSLRFYWVALIAVFFMLVEEFFLKKGLYVHFWWKTYYTGLGTFFILLAMREWYKSLKARTHAFWRFAAFYCISWLLLVGPTLVLMLVGKQHFSSGLSLNYYLDDIFAEVPYCLLLSLAAAYFIAVCKKPYFKAVPFVLLLAGDALLTQAGVLTFQGGWSPFYLAELRVLCLLFFIVLEKHAFVPRPAAPSV